MAKLPVQREITGAWVRTHGAAWVEWLATATDKSPQVVDVCEAALNVKRDAWPIIVASAQNRKLGDKVMSLLPRLIMMAGRR